MSTRLLHRYVPLGGSSRRYLDKETGLTISRRAFLKLQGIIPEQRARERRAMGLIPRRKQRKDAGNKPPPLVWAEARTVKYVGRNAQIVPYNLNPKNLLARRFAIFIDYVHGADVHSFRLRRRPRAVWRCSCHDILKNKEELVAHVATHHLRGFGAKSIPYPGEVHSHERRVRMPCRVEAPEYR